MDRLLQRPPADRRTTLTAHPERAHSCSRRSGLGERLSVITEQHEAYPLLHFYHAAEEHRSTSAALAGSLRDEEEQRRLLFALVQNDRRAWPPADRD